MESKLATINIKILGSGLPAQHILMSPGWTNPERGLLHFDIGYLLRKWCYRSIGVQNIINGRYQRGRGKTKRERLVVVLQ